MREINYQAVDDNVNVRSEAVEIPTASWQGRSKAFIGIVGLMIICGSIVIFQAGNLRGDVFQSISFAAQARVAVGSLMRNGDEIWPCDPEPLPKAKCYPDVSKGEYESNMYLAGGSKANLPPYRMVFYNGNMLLYSIWNVKPENMKFWKMTFENLNPTKKVEQYWGKPYWTMENAASNTLKGEYTSAVVAARTKSLYSQKELVDAGVNRLGFMKKGDKIPGTSDTYSSPMVVFRAAKDVNSAPTDVYRIKGISQTWGCDQLEFLITPDGNLLLVAITSDKTKLELIARKMPFPNCNTALFQTGNYKYITKKLSIPDLSTAAPASA